MNDFTLGFTCCAASLGLEMSVAFAPLLSPVFVLMLLALVHYALTRKR